jgi:hypothetical protein
MSVDEENKVYTHMEYYSAFKRKKTLKYVTKMDEPRWHYVK